MTTTTDIYFSPSKAAFYAGTLQDVYGSAWPADAVVVTADVHDTFTRQAPVGQMLGSANGQPAWVAFTAPAGAVTQTTMAQQATSLMSATAAAWGFSEGIDGATTWVTSGNAQWAAEAQALATWRDAVRTWLLTTPTDITQMPAAPVRPGDAA